MLIIQKKNTLKIVLYRAVFANKCKLILNIWYQIANITKGLT